MSTAYSIRPLRPSDDAQVQSLIRDVMTELGASGPGFAIHDPEVAAMSQAYAGPRARYFVLVDSEDRVCGGAGIAQLAGENEGICELRKMYFRPETRGKGLGDAMLTRCLEEAKRLGYRVCYLETLKSMDKARKLYERHGFVRRSKPLGATGHFGCDAWYEKGLE